jgi:nicotinate-nucleotide adenylyltransferase
VAAHKPVWYLVPDGVVQYIAKYGLYLDGPGEGASGHVSVGPRASSVETP